MFFVFFLTSLQTRNRHAEQEGYMQTFIQLLHYELRSQENKILLIYTPRINVKISIGFGVDLYYIIKIEQEACDRQRLVASFDTSRIGFPVFNHNTAKTAFAHRHIVVRMFLKL